MKMKMRSITEATKFRAQISIIACLMLLWNPFGAAEKINAKIDVALMWPASVDPKTEFGTMQKKFADLTDVFEMGDDKVKISIVESVEAGHNLSKLIAVPLMGNEIDFKKRLHDWKPSASSAYWISDGFDAARSEVFKESKMRTKVVIVFQNHHSAYEGPAGVEAADLRADGAIVYVVSLKGFKIEAENWTSNAARIVETATSDDFFNKPVESIMKLQPQMLRDLCQWTTACRFEQPNQKQCVAGSVLPFPTIFNYKGQQLCATVQPPTPAGNISCAEIDCENECDRRWRWNAECKNNCGVAIKRVDEAPYKMENCLRQIQCEPCPTTPSTTVATIPEPDFPWLIVGVVVGIVAVLILIAVIVVVVKKKKKAAIVAKEKESKLGASAKERPKMEKNPSIMSLGKEASFAGSMVGGKEGAEASVVADLQDASIMKPKSKMVPIKKTVAPSGSKMMPAKKAVQSSSGIKTGSAKKSIMVIKK